MEDDIFTWIGVLALPIAVASLLFALLSIGALNYDFNSTQFIVNESNVSINETYLSQFGNITYNNNTYINQTANLSGYWTSNGSSTATGNWNIPIRKATTLTDNGFLKTSGGDGTLSVDTSTYLTTETDPKVGTLTNTYIPKWSSGDGSLVDSGIVETATGVGIGTTTPSAKLAISQTGSVNNVAFRVYDETLASEEFAIKKVSASGYRILGRGFSTIPAVDTRGFSLLTSWNAAQSIMLKGIFMGAAYPSDETGVGTIRTAAATDITLSPASSVAMTIKSGGNVGIGTTTPTEKLEIDGNLFLNGDNDKILLGAGKDASISYDGTNMIFDSSEVGSGLAYFSNNVSATGYITRTETYDKSKGSALDLIKDSSELRDSKGNIKHEEFYGYVEQQVTDYSKPEIEYYQVEVPIYENITITEEVCNYEKSLFKSSYEKVCKNETKVITQQRKIEDGEECSYKQIDNKKEYEKVCEPNYKEVYQNITKERIIYPHKKTEDGVNIVDEIELLRQALVEQKIINTNLQSQLEDLNIRLTKLEDKKI
jgi:hypothetical protein